MWSVRQMPRWIAPRDLSKHNSHTYKHRAFTQSPSALLLGEVRIFRQPPITSRKFSHSCEKLIRLFRPENCPLNSEKERARKRAIFPHLGDWECVIRHNRCEKWTPRCDQPNSKRKAHYDSFSEQVSDRHSNMIVSVTLITQNNQIYINGKCIETRN